MSKAFRLMHANFWDKWTNLTSNILTDFRLQFLLTKNQPATTSFHSRNSYEIYDYLRLLYARVGTPHCPECKDRIKPQTIDEIVDKILAMGEGTKIQIMAPIIRGKKEFTSVLEELRQELFSKN